MTAKYAFSIIIAVYNCEPFLQETLNSLVNQTFDFSRVEVLLVDDGSSDSSGELCDSFAKRYPDNTVLIHKPNGGVSSARNAGVQMARGEYINFLDSDDKLSPTTLEDVYTFFQTYPEQTDVVTIPMKFFDAAQGSHWLNGKFENGTRLIDLEKEPYHCVLSVSASFYPMRVKPALHFNEKQRLAEDAIVNARILCDRPRLGVVHTCSYQYRRRSMGDSSAIQSATKKKWYYLDYMHYFVEDAIAYAQSVKECVPRYIQFALACDLHWRIRDPKPLEGVLQEDEQDAYIRLLHWAFEQIDDEVLCAVPGLSKDMCYKLLYFKHQKADLCWKVEDADVFVHGNPVGTLGMNRSRLEVVTLRDGILEIDATIWQYACEERNQSIWACVDDVKGHTVIPCVSYARRDLEQKVYDIPLCYATGFRVKIDLRCFSGAYTISFYQGNDTNLVRKRYFETSFYCALGSRWPTQYVCESGYLLKLQDGKICVQPASRRIHLHSELCLLSSLITSKKMSDRKAVIARVLYWIGRVFLRKPIWLICDKYDHADDNGEAFFRFLCEKKPKGIRYYFVLDHSATAYPELAQLGKVLSPTRYLYKVLYLLSTCIISSQADKESTNPFHDYWHPYQDLLSKAHTVFLQHGIIKDDLSSWLQHGKQNLSGFVTSTKDEYNSIVTGDYGYTEKEVWLTGLPRFDRLYRDEQKVITIMPTWRRYLLDIDRINGGWKARDGFFESNYFSFYSKLLNHPRLHDAAQQYGYQIHFRPHPNTIRYAKQFVTDSRVVVDEQNKSYRQIYAESNLIVTDYSSVVMDFAYMNKPVLYCHFDATEFFGGKHMYVRGYYDYERDGFGEVEYDLESIVDRIIEYIKNGCILKKKYQERISHFFTYNDHENCQRVYEKILELT